jgi:hypothetical protein
MHAPRRRIIRDPFTGELQHELAVMVGQILEVAARGGSRTLASAAELSSTRNQMLAMAIMQTISDRLSSELPQTHPFLKKELGYEVSCQVLEALERLDQTETEVRRYAKDRGVPFSRHAGTAISLLVIERIQAALPKNP